MFVISWRRMDQFWHKEHPVVSPACLFSSTGSAGSWAMPDDRTSSWHRVGSTSWLRPPSVERLSRSTLQDEPVSVARAPSSGWGLYGWGRTGQRVQYSQDAQWNLQSSWTPACHLPWEGNISCSHCTQSMKDYLHICEHKAKLLHANCLFELVGKLFTSYYIILLPCYI